MNRNNDHKKELVFYKQTDIVNTENYKSVTTRIPFVQADFHNLAGNYYPKKSLTNSIGHAAGIEYIGECRMEDVFDEKISPDGTVSKIRVGIRAFKKGRKRRPDGTWAVSSECSYEFNWEDRAEEDFLKDEELYYTGGDAKYTFPDDENRQKIMRRKRINALKKFATQRASTGAELMVIRELVGMPTGFKKDELSVGYIEVSQVCESQKLQDAKAKAHLVAIASGKDNNSAISKLLGIESEPECRETTEERNYSADLQPEEPIMSDEEKYAMELEKCTEDFREYIENQIRQHMSNPNVYRDALTEIERYNYGKPRNNT